MSGVPIEKILDKADGSIYKLVNLVVQRALEVAEGAPKLVNLNSSTKPTSVALEEIAAGKVSGRKKKDK